MDFEGSESTDEGFTFSVVGVLVIVDVAMLSLSALFFARRSKFLIKNRLPYFSLGLQLLAVVELTMAGINALPESLPSRCGLEGINSIALDIIIALLYSVRLWVLFFQMNITREAIAGTRRLNEVFTIPDNNLRAPVLTSATNTGQGNQATLSMSFMPISSRARKIGSEAKSKSVSSLFPSTLHEETKSGVTVEPKSQKSDDGKATGNEVSAPIASDGEMADTTSTHVGRDVGNHDSPKSKPCASGDVMDECGVVEEKMRSVSVSSHREAAYREASPTPNLELGKSSSTSHSPRADHDLASQISAGQCSSLHQDVVDTEQKEVTFTCDDHHTSMASFSRTGVSIAPDIELGEVKVESASNIGHSAPSTERIKHERRRRARQSRFRILGDNTWFIKHKFLIKRKFLLLVVAIVASGAVVLGIVASDMSVVPPNQDDCTLPLWTRGLLLAALAPFVLFWVFCLHKTRDVRDNFLIAHEFKYHMVIAAVWVTCVVMGSMTFTADEFVFEVFDGILQTLPLVSFVVLACVPLWNQRKLDKAIAAREITADRLADLLQTPEGVESFRQFLAKDFCAENIEFYESARLFKERYHVLTPETRTQSAERIYNTFIRWGAALEINIPSAVRVNLEEALEVRFPDESDSSMERSHSNLSTLSGTMNSTATGAYSFTGMEYADDAVSRPERLATVECAEVPITAFDEAQQCIFRLMEIEPWLRFSIERAKVDDGTEQDTKSLSNGSTNV